MTIYVSKPPWETDERDVQIAINAFSKQIESCPCGSEEFILRFGSLPYLVCLSCGRTGRSGMGGMGVTPQTIKEDVSHYLREFREGRSRLSGLRDFREFALQSTFKITIGGEISKNFSVEPVDSSFPSKVEALYQKGER